MNCVICSYPLPPLRTDLRPERPRPPQQKSPSQLPSLCSFGQMMRIYPQRQRFASLQAGAIPSNVVLAATSPAKSGDVSVLLQTGGVLLIAYFIANFIVPALIMKSYQSGEGERQKSEGKDPVEEDEETDASERGGQARPLRAKKQGFGNNKR